MNSVPKNRFANSHRINSKALYHSTNSSVYTFPRVIRKEITQRIPQRDRENEMEIGRIYSEIPKTGIIMIDHAKKDLEKRSGKKKNKTCRISGTNEKRLTRQEVF
ncbi:hypothetical protein CEXT_206991 [Caerostris extrusa]|uniref:Uncharacterized protein n=1 Tax=Caerostris extrusa TaxID=172846 RepID=A0AAV4Q584_CAEEX|nr:hypothetical protein CEXT_206991 [Caerostris extrusa]